MKKYILFIFHKHKYVCEYKTFCCNCSCGWSRSFRGIYLNDGWYYKFNKIENDKKSNKV